MRDAMMRDAPRDAPTARRPWAVVTTIFTVNAAVKLIATNYPSMGLVVVGDRKTNHSEWEAFSALNRNVEYLSPERQLSLGFRMVQFVPWNHFGRKSVGYLYAIKQGATDIFDFDDDNHLTAPIETLDAMETYTVRSNRHHVFNPYPSFEPRNRANATAFIWPRGYPLQFIKDDGGATVVPSRHAAAASTIAVHQSLANHDPDVDAVYRMTRELPIYFQRRGAKVLPPRGTFVPWNAQAVFVSAPAFFGLLLPITVPGRVSDIWRSYLVTRLLWETNYRVAFTSAIVAQYRNPHSYLADLVDERDLYYKADSVLALLANWTSGAAPTLDVAYLALFDLFVERDVLRPSDAQIARAWVDDLKAVGYAWPAITRRHPAFVPRPPPIVDQRYLGDPLASAMARERPHRRRADGPAAHSATGESRRASSLSPEAAACETSPHEPLLVRLTAHILTNVVGAGSVVDCGAQKGGETCLYARTSPWRTVHAVEPLPANVLRIMQLARSSPNIQPLHGGLGSSDRTVSLSGSQTKTMLTHVDRRPTVSNDSKRAFRIYRLDSLFFAGPWASERLAFGHFDVEGSEYDLLRGAAAVLQRDRPIFTVEMALGDAKASQTLLEEVEAQGFRAYMVPEVCGLNRDCRNFICVPSEQPLTDRLLVQSTVPVEAKSFDPSALMRVPIIRPESKT